MAYESEELNARRKEREQLRQQRLAQDRRLKKRLLIAALVLVACGGVIAAVWLMGPQPAQGDAIQPTTVPTIQTESETEPTQNSTANTYEGETVIHIAAAGDLVVTDALIATGGVERNFTEIFTDVLPLLTDADLTLLNFEGNLVGQPYGAETASAPPELLQALISSGVDMVQVANSKTISNGMSGLASTLYAIKAAGLEPLGAYASVEDAKKGKGYTIVEVEGISIAFVAFTKGMENSMALPSGSEQCVNLLYKDYSSTFQVIDGDNIRRVLRAAASERPDITIVLLHWGSEYNDMISGTQEWIKEIMFDEGADAIIGTHPHYVQSIEFDPEQGTFICYSLGDFLSDATRGGTEYSIILDLEITKNNETDKTRISGYSYTPIFTVAEDDILQLVRLDEAVLTFEAENIDAVQKATYEAMLYAQERVAYRITAKLVAE